jgi:hypothetical protein
VIVFTTAVIAKVGRVHSSAIVPALRSGPTEPSDPETAAGPAGDAQPVRIHAHIRHATKAPTDDESLPGNQFSPSRTAVHPQIEISISFHIGGRNIVPLLPGVLLRDLRFDAWFVFFSPPKGRHRFTGLKINGTQPVWMMTLSSSFPSADGKCRKRRGRVFFSFANQMMVINECAIKQYTPAAQRAQSRWPRPPASPVG